MVSYAVQGVYPRLATLFPQLHHIQPASPWGYNSPFNVIIAILLFEFFRGLSIPCCQKALIFGSKYCFGVFLNHCQYHLYESMGGRFHWIGRGPMLAVPLTVCCAVAIFIACVGMDWCREKVFMGFLSLGTLVYSRSK